MVLLRDEPGGLHKVQYATVAHIPAVAAAKMGMGGLLSGMPRAAQLMGNTLHRPAPPAAPALPAQGEARHTRYVVDVGAMHRLRLRPGHLGSPLYMSRWTLASGGLDTRAHAAIQTAAFCTLLHALSDQCRVVNTQQRD